MKRRLFLLANLFPLLAQAQNKSLDNFKGLVHDTTGLIIAVVIIVGIFWIAWELTLGKWWRNR
jgi:hypothetical protein